MDRARLPFADSSPDDRLYVALAGGGLGIYFFTPPSSPYTENGKGKGRVKELAPPTVKLMTTKKAFSRRPIEQLGWIEETNELVVLSGESRAQRVTI